MWTNRYSGTGKNYDEPQALALDANGDVYVIGSSWTGSVYSYALIKYSNSGVALWTNLFGRLPSYIRASAAIATDTNGNVIATGTSMANGWDDYETVKYSSTGVPSWTNHYNGPGNFFDTPVGVAVDGSGNVFVTGVSDGTGTDPDFATVAYSATGVPLWTNRYDGPGDDVDRPKAIAVNHRGEVFVAGDSRHVSGAGLNYTTLAYSSAGLPLWTNFYIGGMGDDEVTAMTIDDNENVIVTGSSVGSGTDYDYATVAYSRMGVPLWTNRYDGPSCSADFAAAIAVARNSDVFVTGSSFGGDSNLDFVTIKYSIARPVALEIQSLNGQAVLTWTNAAFGLQSAPTITGTFTNLPTATSPYTNPITGGQQFFRLISN